MNFNDRCEDIQTCIREANNEDGTYWQGCRREVRVEEGWESAWPSGT